MSSPSRRRPPLPVFERRMCACAHGADCSSYAAGHALPLIQARLAAATPAGWVDAIVEAVDAAHGRTDVRAVSDGTRIELWHAGVAAAAVGEPVAVHVTYGVLAAGDRRRSVAVLA